MYHDQSLQCCLSGLYWATSNTGHDGRVTSAFIVMAIKQQNVYSHQCAQCSINTGAVTTKQHVKNLVFCFLILHVPVKMLVNVNA